MNKDAVNDSEVIDPSVVNEQTETSQLKKTNKDERESLDPTRYGDWEKNGRCIDF